MFTKHRNIGPLRGQFTCHDDVIKRKHFPRYWSFVRGIHRSPVNSPHKGQWHGALMFSVICAWINGWVNSRGDGDFRRHRAHYDVIVMPYDLTCLQYQPGHDRRSPAVGGSARSSMGWLQTLHAQCCHSRWWNPGLYRCGLAVKEKLPWWRHQMETFSALLAICAGNSPVPGEFPTQRPVTRSFVVFFDQHPNKRLSKQWRGWWFETPSCPLWRHRNAIF